MSDIRIYVASLSDYNAGRLHGRWIDATQDADDIHAEVQAMLARSAEPNAEEWAIHDYEGFESIKLGEWESFERVSKLAQLIEKHGEAFAAWYDNESRDDSDDLEEMFRESYRGEWDSFKDYVYELVEDLGFLKDVPEEVAQYFDYDAYARDLEMGNYWTHTSRDYKVFVFESN